jgi:glutamyl-tRNA synthetase
MLAQLDAKRRGQLQKAMAGLKERAKTLVELKAGAAFLFAARPLALDEKAKQIIADGGKTVLQDMVTVLEACADWFAPVLEAAVKGHAEASGIKLGKLAQPLRAALTGTSTSPPIFDVLEVLGREEAIARINDLLN